MANLSKSIIVSSVASVASLLDTQYNDIKQRLSDVANLSSKDKADLQAASTKVKYFTGLSSLISTNEKAVSSLYYIVKNAKAEPADLLKEIAINSYSLNKFGFMIRGIANGFYDYDLSDMSASNIIAILDFIKDDKTKFTMRQYRDQMTSHKEKADKKADSGFTQTNQALKLCERLGIVSYTGGKISLGYGEYKINSENDLVKYLKSIFTKDKEKQKELDLAIAE
ncbi:hypothetical protein [Xenorhabdus szentirmaii]|uniref:Uncharacterized protein n=1 Tax=Xenorhabdus szentirmaii DSM 16338 TaxID=1427518 RepID=W1IUX5_9GAMM|nr:hypothetical protein [Xenorhabdus szentirmaii]PHM30542.1 hypothetical protein Xsze_04132 [Xenorhabdus szentirmaii DSM 16338]CDL81000.1 conserved hypothetical protein [Xenorhabdus szentirmaii DSM 16338]